MYFENLIDYIENRIKELELYAALGNKESIAVINELKSLLEMINLNMWYCVHCGDYLEF